MEFGSRLNSLFLFFVCSAAVAAGGGLSGSALLQIVGGTLVVIRNSIIMNVYSKMHTALLTCRSHCGKGSSMQVGWLTTRPSNTCKSGKTLVFSGLSCKRRSKHYCGAGAAAIECNRAPSTGSSHEISHFGDSCACEE